MSATLMHDAVTGRETQAAPALIDFGREKRFEEMRFHVFTHSGSVIGDANDNVLTRAAIAAVKRGLGMSRKIGNACVKSQLSALRHSISRVYREVQNDLGDLLRIGFDVSAVLFVMEVADDRDVFADESEQGTFKIGEDGIDFDNYGFHSLPPAECEKLLRERRRATSRSANLRDVIGQGPFDLPFVKKQVAVAENGREKIIEIVGDASGQLTECFHSL